MNAEEYAEYQASVDRNLEGCTHESAGPIASCSDCFPDIFPCLHCSEPIDEDHEAPDIDSYDESFSWSPCEVCNSTLGGNRYPVHARGKPTKEEPHGPILHFEACIDCFYYVTYGRIDDQTRDEIENSKTTGP